MGLFDKFKKETNNWNDAYKANPEFYSKDDESPFKLNMCYSGTCVANGFGVIEVTAVGKNTEIGLIGESLREIEKEKTPLEKQINKLILVCASISGFIFLLTILNFFYYFSV